MKQIFASHKGVTLEDVTSPEVSRGSIKIKVEYSCISAGTEMHNIQGTTKSVFQRVKDSPERIKKAIDVVMESGITKAREQVEASLNRLISSGYSISGQVVAVGKDVSNFKVGDLVAAGGAGIAVHAEYVSVPKNLVVHVPEGLDLSYASIGTVGSIAMQGVRRADLRLSEYGVVIGCGLMGLLAIQMLKASGVKVACTDVNPSRLALAEKLGADKVINSSEEDPVVAIRNWTNGYGVDAALFTAATQSSEPLSQAFRMCRKRGRVVLLGVSGMELKREDMYANELDFLISTSYGPGRYDPDYESKGVEYPYAYVRWTENRNIESFLELIRDGKINIAAMMPKVYKAEEADKAFDGLKSNPGEHIVTLIDYTDLHSEGSNEAVRVHEYLPVKGDRITIGLIGAGGFATGTLLPIIYNNDNKFRLKTIVNRTGEKALNAARQFNAERTSSNIDDILNDPEIDVVMICTRHNNHAELVLKALQAGKNVYVEKPLATTMDQLNMIKQFYKENEGQSVPNLMVGFNRRFSKYAVEVKRHLDKRTAPVFVRYRMNAGFIPADVWVHGDGGRIIGEGCHIIDLMQYLVNKDVTTFSESHFQPKQGMYLSEDNRFITMEFSDGSVAQVEYFACGSKDLPKEYMEVHWEGKSIIMDDFTSLTGYGVKVKQMKETQTKKGHKEEWLALYDCFIKGQNPIDLNCLFKTTELSILSAQ